MVSMSDIAAVNSADELGERVDTGLGAPSTEQFMVEGGTITAGIGEFRVSLFTTVVPAGDPY